MKLSSREKKLLIFLAVLAVAAGIVWLAIIPIIDNASKLNAQKADYNLQLIDAKSKGLGEDELNKKLDDIILAIQARTNKYLPTNKMDQIMTFLEDKSKQAGIKITGVRFLTPELIDPAAQQEPSTQPNSFEKAVSDINTLNAGFMPQASSAPQPTPVPTASAQTKQEDMISTVDMAINVTGTFSDVESFVKMINESGKYLPITGLDLARDKDGKISGLITIRFFQMPVPESTSGTDQSGGTANTPRDPFSGN